MRPWISAVAAWCLVLGGGAALARGATSRESPADVAAAVRAALPVSPGTIVEIGPSAAGHMERCRGPLTTTVMGRGVRRAVRVACRAPRWSLYVEASVVRKETVLVATRSLAMGHRLEKGDFRVVRATSSEITGQPISAQEAIGKNVAVPLSTGEDITKGRVIVPEAIRAGEHVLIQWEAGGVSASAAGTALESGGVGQRILLENDASEKRVTAVIVGAGEPQGAGGPFVAATR